MTDISHPSIASLLAVMIANDQHYEAATILALRAALDAAEADKAAAVEAGWEACRTSIYAVCEDVRGKALDGLSKAQTEHEEGYRKGEAWAAKSIARGFGAMNARDDDNVTAVLAAIRARGAKP